MAYLNKCEIIGNLGKDAITTTLNNGGKKVSFSVAVSKKYRDKSGEQKEQTTWFPVTVFGKLAETVEKLSLKKGTMVFVCGEIGIRQYTDQDGAKRTAVDLNADTIQILSSRASAPSQGYDYSNPVDVGQNAETRMEPPTTFAQDEELPF